MKTEISVESKHQTLQGLAFPLQPEAQRALQQLKQKTVNYIQLVGTQSRQHTQARHHRPLLFLVICVCKWPQSPVPISWAILLSQPYIASSRST